MANYSTFFVCKPEELAGGLPGWRLPLAQPVRREFRNPFTGKASVVESREPEWPEGAFEDLGREYRVVAIEGRYEDYLEGRLPPFVRSCPHWATKGLSELELAPLCEAVRLKPELECVIYSPPSSGAVVQQLPAELLAKLASLDDEAVAGRWAAAMSLPEHTHSVSGEKLSDGWVTHDALAKLRALKALAREAAAGQRLYLLIEA